MAERYPQVITAKAKERSEACACCARQAEGSEAQD
jgi:hypothetical protein